MAGLTIYLTFDDAPSPNLGTETTLDVLSKSSLRATFFVNMSNVENNPSRQKALLQRMIDEGHVIGNQGYKHASTANKQYYESISASKIEEDFDKNELMMENLNLKGQNSCPVMEIARLQGDGRFEPKFVTMITKELKTAHAGWNVEFFPNGQFGKRPAIRDWMNITGVSADLSGDIKFQDIVLMHDAHWAAKKDLLIELIGFLSSHFTIKPLDKTSPGVRHP